MKVRATLSANAGICLEFGGCKFWVDALHSHHVTGFSSVSQTLWEQIWQCQAFADPDVICVTHDHPDHYDKTMIMHSGASYPRAKVIVADAAFGQEKTWEIGSCRLQLIRLPHEGAQFASCVHYGILLSAEGKNILLPADCRLEDSTLEASVADKQIDLAFLNFPWLTLKRGQEFVKRVLKPRKTVLYHLPFSEDDVNGFRLSAEKVAEKENATLLWNPLQTVELDIL